MNKSGVRPAAAERARWLAELATAVDEAQCVARAWNASHGSSAEANLLLGRLAQVRVEVADLRGAGSSARAARIDPPWTSLFPTTQRSQF